MVLEDFLKVMEDMETSKIFNLNVVKVEFELMQRLHVRRFSRPKLSTTQQTSPNYLISKCPNMYTLKLIILYL